MELSLKPVESDASSRWLRSGLNGIVGDLVGDGTGWCPEEKTYQGGEQVSLHWRYIQAGTEELTVGKVVAGVHALGGGWA